jgi:hypothetical protein
MSTKPAPNEPTAEDAAIASLRARLREIAMQLAHKAKYQVELFVATDDPNDLCIAMNAARLAKELAENEDEWLMRIRGAAKDKDTD